MGLHHHLQFASPRLSGLKAEAGHVMTVVINDPRLLESTDNVRDLGSSNRACLFNDEQGELKVKDLGTVKLLS